MKLNWKLTLSYTLVTVAALMVIEGAVLGGLLLVTGNAKKASQMTAGAIMESAAQLAPFFDGPQIDVSGIAGWLGHAAASGFSTRKGLTEFSVTMGQFTGGDNWMAALDAKKRVLAAFPHDAGQKIQEAVSGDEGSADQASLQSLVTLALSGETNPESLFLLTPERRLVIAVPILDRIPGQDSRILGTLVVFTLFPQLGGTYRELFSILAGSLVIFTIGAGILGTVFGHLSARGLVGRLAQFMKVSMAWSSGDLAARIADKSKDEIGILASRLNAMAEELLEMVQIRQSLAVMEERHRLARELHDSVKQRAFAAAMQIGCASQALGKDQKAAMCHLNSAEELVHQIQTELSGLLSALRPAYLQGRTLVQAIGTLAYEWASQTGIMVETELQDVGRLPPTVEEAFFRVAEEALSNAGRHSQAKRVTVSLIRENGSAVLSIADNGKGFDQSAVRLGGAGILNMRERMAEVGGSLKVASREGSGSRITAIWPITREVEPGKRGDGNDRQGRQDYGINGGTQG